MVFNLIFWVHPSNWLLLTHVAAVANLKLANINHYNNAAFTVVLLKWAASLEMPINQ